MALDTFRKSLFLFPILLISLLANPVIAQDFDLAEITSLQVERRAMLEAISVEMATNNLADSRLREIRTIARNVRSSSRALADQLRQRQAVVLLQIAELGETPAGIGPEDDAFGTVRTDLFIQSQRLEDIMRQSDSNFAESSRLLSRVSAQRRNIYLSEATQSAPLVFDAQLWSNGLQNYAASLNSLWSQATQSTNDTISLRIVFALALLFGGPFLAFGLRRLASNQLVHQIEHLHERHLRQLAFATVTLGLVGLWVLASLFSVAQGAALFGVSALQNAAVLAILFQVGLCLAFGGVSGASLVAPRRHEFRVVHVDDRNARRIGRLFWWCAIGLAAFLGFNWIATMAAFPVEATIIQSYVFTIVVGPALFLLGGTTFWHSVLFRVSTRGWPPAVINGLTRAAATLAVGAALVGYPALGALIVVKALFLTALGATVYYVHRLSTEAVIATHGPPNEDQSSEASLSIFWINFGLDALILLVSLPIFLIIFGIDWIDLADWLTQAFFGIQIGPVTISIANILFGIGLFVALLSATRLFQLVLDRTILPRTKIEPSIRNSLQTIVGYVGLVIALTAAISAFGFNLTGVALIAGALSVGIGFGLQSIVNNFVSGLILLFERPIKVGDWIVATSAEGIVKKIGIRSTEIETFERSSIIVPNSELITAPITNWMLKDRVGRVIVPFGVSYRSDPEQVRDIALHIAGAHPLALREPEPFVYFANFGDSSLDFELRVFISDVQKRFFVGNDIRIALFKAFREQGIAIPFPQRDVHLYSQSE